MLLNAQRQHPVSLVLIGEGPARLDLEAQARSAGVHVVFLGAIYDETTIGAILLNARLVIAPGKVGLTAMHSLAYGVPVLTHGDFNLQMPEVEAVISGITGDFFDLGSTDSLARVLAAWLERPKSAEERKQCVARIEAAYTPERQVELIEAAIASGDRLAT
jgi:glycosyltransferase involved in cell wall biosynthesis